MSDVEKFFRVGKDQSFLDGSEETLTGELGNHPNGRLLLNPDHLSDLRAG